MQEPLAAHPSPALGPAPSAQPYVVQPPALRARRIALALSAVAVGFSLGCGFCARQAYGLRESAPDILLPWLLAFLLLLLVALLLRMAAAICELLWLERTWSNLPEPLRKVGPIDDVSSGMAVAVSFVPGVAWVWKLGLVVGIANGFEAVRAHAPFAAPVPKRLGMAAVIVGWIPVLNVYLAPFLWEMFATRIDVCVTEMRDRHDAAGAGLTSTSGARTGSAFADGDARPTRRAPA